MPPRAKLVLGFFVASLAWSKPPADLNSVLDRIDKAGATFKGMSAHLHRITHTAVISEDDVDSGTMLLKRARARDMRMLVDFTQPDPKTVAFQGRKVEIYYPKIETVQEYDVGKSRALLDEFFLIGFGTSRAELQTPTSCAWWVPTP